MSEHAFHLLINSQLTRKAQIAIIPGDPARVSRIAKYLQDAKQIGQNREYTSYCGTIEGKPVVVCSTGIGGPSVSICVEELARLGVKTFIRVGTTGAIQKHIRPGDSIVVNAAVRLDGASYHFVPPEFPAVADFNVTTALVQAARQLNAKFHVGIAASSDTFYQGQERYNTYTGRVIKRFQGSMEEWQSMGVLNYEMETATLFSMCQAMGLASGCIAGVIANRTETELPDESIIATTEEKAILVAIEAIKAL